MYCQEVYSLCLNRWRRFDKRFLFGLHINRYKTLFYVYYFRRTRSLVIDMSSDNEPTWRICRKAVWMLIQNVNNLADAEALLNRQENDLHIASGKCFILLLVYNFLFYSFFSKIQYVVTSRYLFTLYLHFSSIGYFYCFQMT